MTTSPPTPDHAFIHENLAAYLAGGLDAADRARFDAHINACPLCFDAFSEARDADRALQRTLGTLAPNPQFEEQVLTHIREHTMNHYQHPMLRRAAYAAAACIALAASGVFANIAMHQEGRLSNPLSRTLAAQADADAPKLAARSFHFTNIFGRHYATAASSDARDSAEEAEITQRLASRQIALDRLQTLKDSQSVVAGKALAKGEAAESEKMLPLPGFTSLTTAQPTTSPADSFKNIAMAPDGRDIAKWTSDDVKLWDISPQNEAAAKPKAAFEVARERSADAPVDSEVQKKSFAFQTAAAPAQSVGGVLDYDYSGKSPTAGVGAYGVSGADTWSGELNGRAAGRSDLRNNVAVAAGNEFNFVGGTPIANSGPVAAISAGSGAPTTGNGSIGGKGDLKGITVTNGGIAYNTAGAVDSGGTSTYGTLNLSGGTLATTKVGSGAVALSEGKNSYTGGTPMFRGTALEDGTGKLQSVTESARQGQAARSPDALGRSEKVASLGDTKQLEADKLPLNFDVKVADGIEHNIPADQAAKLGNNQWFDSAGNARTQGTPSNVQAPRISLSDPAQMTAFGDAPTDFDHHATLFKINDLNRFYETTATAPAPDLYAMASPNSPASNLVAAATPPAPAAPSAGTPSANPAPQAEIAALKIIRNGTLEFEVASFDLTYRTVTRIVTEDNGFVSSTSSEKLANGHVRGTIVVRVPPANLDHFLAGLRGLGDLKAQQIGAADVTKQYYDIDSELRGLTTMETRLLDLIKNGKGEVKDLIEAEKQLGETRIKIEKLKGEISYYNNLVALATITITAYEKDIASPTSASEMETVVTNIQTEQVESQYQAARRIFDDAKGRIIESQLKNADADHVAAHIVADVPPAQADFVANQLKQLGVVASFNRDRKQTTAGGTGAPIPGVQVEKKDTRFTVELFNLANLNPRETTVLRIAVRDVEAAYKNVIALVKQSSGADALVGRPADAANAPASQPATPQLTGRITSSNLTGQVPEQMSADIRGELRADNADTIVAAIRASGEVITGQLNTNQDNASTTSAKRGISITLINIAAVSPKEADSVNIAVPDVDAAYKAALAAIRKEAPAGTGAAATLLPPTMGRVISSSEQGQPAEATANIQAELRADQSDAVLAAIRASGEVLSATATENPDTVNSTRLKRGLAVHFVSAASVNARELRDLKARAKNVADAYAKLLDSLQTLAARNAGVGAASGVGGDVRVITSSLNDADPRNANARFIFEARRSALADVEKAFTAAGIEFPVTTVVRSTDTVNTLDSKVRFQISDLLPAETMDPKRTFTIGLEVQDVDAAINRLRNAALKPSSGIRESDFNISRDPSGRITAHIVLDAVVSSTPAVQADIDALDGITKSTQETQNPQAPETKSFTKNRFDLTLSSRAAIVSPNQGLANSARAALSNAAGALFLALDYILTGLLFAVPFALVAWPVWKIMKRRKPAKA